MELWLIFVLASCSLTVPAPCEGRLGVARYKGALDMDNIGLESDTTTKVAHLLIQKRFRNSFIVEGLDLIVEYNIFNVGPIVASRVHLKDSSFEDDSNFIRVSGFTDVDLGRIPAGANVSHIIVVRPVRPGHYNFTGAQITYSPGEEQDDVIGTSSEPGTILVHSSVAYHRTNSPHYEEWMAFGVLLLPSLIIPYMLWFSSQSKYERMAMLRETDKMSRVPHCRRD
ncbi:Translocon-associated protein subunit beta [Orchesella cincta]|uniref:Translocon-associated protein subunit beta n=1 Tax=Orchesella cincta TaxID=48709 RepID=A0A1D2N527_ORCCI|nr:Translocon-associated protein subunit beta [Orchesella cincta]